MGFHSHVVSAKDLGNMNGGTVSVLCLWEEEGIYGYTTKTVLLPSSPLNKVGERERGIASVGGTLS